MLVAVHGGPFSSIVETWEQVQSRIRADTFHSELTVGLAEAPFNSDVRRPYFDNQRGEIAVSDSPTDEHTKVQRFQILNRTTRAA